MVKKKRKLNKKKVAFAIVVVLIFLFGIYKGVTFLVSSIQNIFAANETEAVVEKVEKKETIEEKVEEEKEKIIVTLDPGHGGADGGAITPDEKYIEKDIVLKVAKFIGEKLEKENIEVVYTRTEDVKLGETNAEGLVQRVNIGEMTQADYFVSIHINSFEEDIKVQGFEVFYDTRSILSKALASKVIDQVQPLDFITGTKILQGEKSLHVIAKNSVPAVLIELGYLDDSDDLKYLKSDKKLKELSNKIADGIIEMTKEK